MPGLQPCSLKYIIMYQPAQPLALPKGGGRGTMLLTGTPGGADRCCGFGGSPGIAACCTATHSTAAKAATKATAAQTKARAIMCPQ